MCSFCWFNTRSKLLVSKPEQAACFKARADVYIPLYHLLHDRLDYAGNDSNQALRARHSNQSKAASALRPAPNSGTAPGGFRAFSQEHHKLTWPMTHAASTDHREMDKAEQWRQDLLTCVQMPTKGLHLHELLTCTQPHLEVHRAMMLTHV